MTRGRWPGEIRDAIWKSSRSALEILSSELMGRQDNFDNGAPTVLESVIPYSR